MRLGFHGSWLGLAMLVAAVACIPLTGCGSSGSDGSDGTPGASTGTLSGTVTNATTSDPCVGATITVTPSAGGPATTASDGSYSVVLPVGAYAIECTMPAYEDGAGAASVLAATTTTEDFELEPEDEVQIVFTGVMNPYAPGDNVMPVVTATPFDGSSILSYLWEQKNSVPVIITGSDTTTPTVMLPGADVYRDLLVDLAHVPERWGVLPINPHQLEEAEAVTLLCTVTTTSGDHTEEVDVHAHLDFGAWATGLRNVPTGLPVLMNGKEQASYNWTILDAPGGNTATLQDDSTKNPWFVPNVEGLYTLTVTDLIDGVMEIPVYVGDWAGGVAGEDVDGPYFEGMCLTCHGGSLDWNDAYNAWRGSGHAHIFTANLNNGGHYSSNCFACHTVGYDTTADNNGMDDQDDYDDFYATMWPGGHLHGDPGNYAQVLASWPNTARMTNIQCENCHGPNGIYLEAHNWSAPAPVADLTQQNPRMSLASDVCAYCHGEPPRHARYQQWEESGHGDYELAIDESASYCNYCHSAQGYINKYTLYLEPGNPAPSNISVDKDDIHPITCVVCHDPHDVGTESGHGTDAPMRVDGNAYNLASGFDATAVGKGAQCTTCHNARRGTRNDASPWPVVTDPPGSDDADQATHGGPQTDVLLGMNAYFVDVGYRGAHSFLTDTCVTCHMALTPPPAELSYNLGGTNHTFEASLDICTDCHGAYDGGTMKEAFEGAMEEMAEAIEWQLQQQFEALVDDGYDVLLEGYDSDDDSIHSALNITVLDDTLITDITLTEFHGRMAMNVTYDGTTVYQVQLSQKTTIRLAATGDFGSMLYSSLWVGDPDELLSKSGWNYFLLHSDGSHGFHNPGFATDVVVQTFYVLETIDWTLVP